MIKKLNAVEDCVICCKECGCFFSYNLGDIMIKKQRSIRKQIEKIIGFVICRGEDCGKEVYINNKEETK